MMSWLFSARRSTSSSMPAGGATWRVSSGFGVDMGNPLGPLVSRGDERRHGEPSIVDPGLLALVEIPPLLAREAVARQRGARGVVELHVDHHDRGDEGHLVLVLDRVGA